MRQLVRKNGHASLRRSLGGYMSELAESAAAIDLDALEEAARLLLDCQARGGMVFTAGNGGSASTASHFACDLMKGTRAGGPPTFRVVALTDNTAQMTAWANDVGYERVFAEQFLSLARPGDLLVAISASGNSTNVLAVAEAASELGIAVIALTGRSGGRLAELADLTVRAPSDRIEIVEDLHLVFAHNLCVTTRERLQNPVAEDTVIAVNGARATALTV
jgi:D-sedoheptulose 7-phosphate isomerase